MLSICRAWGDSNIPATSRIGSPSDPVEPEMSLRPSMVLIMCLILESRKKSGVRHPDGRSHRSEELS